MDFNPHLLVRVQFVDSADNALSLDHNANLAPWERKAPNNVAGKGKIEEIGHMENTVWQTRAAPPSAFENALGDALEQVFESGATTLDEVVAGLNARGLRTSGGEVWTQAGYEAELARLGA